MQNFMFQLQFHKLKIMKNYFSNWNQILREKLNEVNINQKQQYKDETNI